MMEKTKTFFFMYSLPELKNAKNKSSEKMPYSKKCTTLSPPLNPNGVGMCGMAEATKINKA